MNIQELKQIVYDHPDEFQMGFDRWLDRHRGMFQNMVDLAMRVKAEGGTRYSIAVIFDSVRYHSYRNDLYGYVKLENKWRSDVARLMMLAYPELKGFFKLRKRTTDYVGCFRLDKGKSGGNSSAA